MWCVMCLYISGQSDCCKCWCFQVSWTLKLQLTIFSVCESSKPLPFQHVQEPTLKNVLKLMETQQFCKVGLCCSGLDNDDQKSPQEIRKVFPKLNLWKSGPQTSKNGSTSGPQSTTNGPQMVRKYRNSTAKPTILVRQMLTMDARSIVRSRGDKGVGYRPPTIRKPLASCP